MQNSKIQTSEAELLPSSELPKFGQEITKVEALSVRLETLRHRVANTRIRDREEFRQGGELVAELKAVETDCEDLMKPFKKILKRVTDFIKKKTDVVYDEATELRKIMNQKMGDWTRQEEEERKAEEARAQAALKLKLEQEAEQKRILDAAAAKERREIRVKEINAQYSRKEITKRQREKLLRDAGAIADADLAASAILAEEEILRAGEKAKELKVESSIPSVAGVTKRKNYWAKCSDRAIFLEACIKDYQATGQFGHLWTYVAISDEKLSETARDTKNPETMRQLVPGAIEAGEDKTF